ncbi:HamA C-terminal domain-containing protein [Mycobacteroides abscessus]|uniref:HamA C-terminal domain-containing protein n=1 Tax=Mycobacteroides abscessus TaxID=36809 RepID=UPI0021034919|nr:DUF1837 domain-containing protein [Mycobacteroides abscessus]
MTPVHEVRYQDLLSSPTVTALCAGYELKNWRTEALADDIFHRHLASFALSFTDFNEINGETAAKALKKAASAVYTTDKYGRRGEFGELLLHAATRDFFGAQPAISKLHFKDSSNDTVKGFDCVHLVDNGKEPELWVGEVKFYSDLTKAIYDSTKELTDHLAPEFLRREFIAITNKLDRAWPHAEAVSMMLDSARSLDQILPHLVIPVMLTYNSPTVAVHDAVAEEYIAALRAEANDGWTKFCDKLDLPVNVVLHLILVPLLSKDALQEVLHSKLKAWQNL